MWDNAQYIRNTANALIALSTLALLYGTAHYAVHLPWVFPLHSVRLSAVPQRVSTAELMQVLRSEVRGNLITMDIGHLRGSLEKLPWVRSANVRRTFPHGLTVQLEEHHAFARWNNSALVNQHGEIFVAISDQELPGFIGKEGSSAEIAQNYTNFNQQLGVLGLSVTQVALSTRHAWQLRLSNGMVLELGREDMQQRLARFVTMYPFTHETIQKVAGRDALKYVDLRYRNGFAVRQLLSGRERKIDRWAVS